MTPKKIFLSRNYVEFGPFEAAEIIDFHRRGIATDGDHIHVIGSDAWITMRDWLGAQAVKTLAKAKPAAKQAARAPRKKAAKTA